MLLIPALKKGGSDEKSSTEIICCIDYFVSGAGYGIAESGAVARSVS